jgi:hypothetical protein
MGTPEQGRCASRTPFSRCTLHRAMQRASPTVLLPSGLRCHRTHQRRREGVDGERVQVEPSRSGGIGRRKFLIGSGSAVAALGLSSVRGGVLEGCSRSSCPTANHVGSRALADGLARTALLQGELDGSLVVANPLLVELGVPSAEAALLKTPELPPGPLKSIPARAETAPRSSDSQAANSGYPDRTLADWWTSATPHPLD